MAAFALDGPVRRPEAARLIWRRMNTCVLCRDRPELPANLRDALADAKPLSS